MSGNLQWIAVHILVTMLLIIVWPFEFITEGKTLLIAIVYCIGSLTFWLYADDKNMKLPQLIKMENEDER